jgi:hypothetical protein
MLSSSPLAEDLYFIKKWSEKSAAYANSWWKALGSADSSAIRTTWDMDAPTGRNG